MSTARYPAARRGRLVLIIAGVVLGAVLLTWTLWTAWAQANPPVAGRIKAWTVVDDATVSVTLTVDRRDPSTRAECFVFAQAESYERVGELPVVVDAGTQRVTDVPVRIKTYKKATSVTLSYCRPAA